jgi:uncharacterized membrane protein YhaH (DUF805 family)
VFGVFLMLGLTLFNRIGVGVAVIILGAVGAYAGWLVGVIVFGALRGSDGSNGANGEEGRT